ncbi:hypothetical protein U1Q18_052331, partial [Sarracenia purpurea var. burkii]
NAPLDRYEFLRNGLDDEEATQEDTLNESYHGCTMTELGAMEGAQGSEGLKLSYCKATMKYIR